MKVTRGVYIAVAAGSVLAVGAAVLLATSKPAQASPNPSPSPSPTPGPSPSPSPSPSPVLIPGIDDNVPPSFVTDAQNRLAKLIAAGKLAGETSGPPLNLPLYTPQDVDGNPQNQKFVTALAAFQNDLVDAITRTALNRAGVLDYLTWAVLLTVDVGFLGYDTSFAVSDPSDIAMAQKALLDQTKMTPLAAGYAVDGTMSPGFVAALAGWQAFIKKEPFPGIAQARSDGTLDSWTLATLVVQAYAL